MSGIPEDDIPCIGMAGIVSREVASTKTFQGTYALVNFTTINEAKAKPAFWLERVAAVAAVELG